jgi:hypothetical protein
MTKLFNSLRQDALVASEIPQRNISFKWRRDNHDYLIICGKVRLLLLKFLIEVFFLEVALRQVFTRYRHPGLHF